MNTLDEVIRGLPYDSDDEDLKKEHAPTPVSPKDAGELWEKYKHRFPPVPTQDDIYERVANIPVTKIKINGCEIEVRQGGLGLPWFIDSVNREKFLNSFEPGFVQEAASQMENLYHRIPFFHDEDHWLPLPGIPASYLPNIRVVEHRTDVEGYDFVTVLHDSERNYTWTYEMSTRERAESFDGKGPLELYELSPSGIRPIRPKCDKYKPFVPVDYFNVPKDVTMFFPRKPLDTGVFRLPKLDDVMNIKMRNMNRDHILKAQESNAPFGYLRPYQNFWKTESTKEHESGPIVRFRRLGGSDLVVSDICLGTMTFGGTVSESSAHKLLDYACDEFGINFVVSCVFWR